MAQVYVLNKSTRKPRAKRASKKRRAVSVARAKSVPRPRKSSHKKRTYKRNPISLGANPFGKVLERQIKPAAIQAGGALAVDIGMGYVSGFLPAQFMNGSLRHATKGLFAVLLSAVASSFVKSATANEMAKGALTVIMHDAAKDFLSDAMPSIPLGYYSSTLVAPQLGYFANEAGGYPQNALGYFDKTNDAYSRSAY